MTSFIVLLVILVNLAWNSEARGGSFAELNPPHPALVDKAPQMVAVMRSVDATDRTTNIWWTQLREKRSKYNAKVVDKTAYCSMWKDLLTDLDAIEEDIDLVKSGLDALSQQLVAIKQILSNTEYNKKSGLHCDGEDNQEEICKVLADLAEHLKEEQTKIEQDLNEINAEKAHVKNYNCDCKYNDWVNAWGECMDKADQVISCGDGFKHETREIKWEKRNDGADCDLADAKRTEECNAGCCPVNCEWHEWSAWGACPEVCSDEPESKKQSRDRTVKISMECGGNKCEGPSEMKQDCDILQVYKDKIAALEAKCPAVQPPVVEPEVKPPVVEPEVQPPVVEPEVQPPVVKPEVQPPVVEPEVQPPVVEPEVQPPVVKPAVQPPVVEPAVQPPVVGDRPGGR